MNADEYTNTIYFDTSALVAAGWPRPSSQLLEVLSQAEQLGLRLALPTTVQCELEEHWLRDLRQKFASAQSAIDGLNRLAAGAITFPKSTQALDRSALLEHTNKRLAEFSARFESVPETKRPVAAFVALAVNRGATFREHGHGFQDAVILCSIIEHMRSNESRHAILVSNDSAFSSESAATFAEMEGVTLHVMKDLDDVGTWLAEQFGERAKEYFEEEKKRMLEAVGEMKSELERHLADRLTFSQDELPIRGTLKQVTGLKLLSVDDAHRAHPMFGDDQRDEGVEQISVDVTVRLTVETERYQSAPLPKFKVGAPALSEPISSDSSVLILRNLLNPERGSTTCDVVVTVDAEATRTDKGFERLNFGWTRLKRQGFGLLGGIGL